MKAILCGPAAALAIAWALSACAGKTGSTAQGCTIEGQDTVYLASGPVYRDCAVDVKARLLTERTVPTDYRRTDTRSADRCIEAEIQFVVDPQGMPEVATARIVRADDQALGEALIRVLPQWRFQPARKGGTAVRQVVRERRGVGLVAFTVARVSAGSPPPPPPPPPSSAPRSC